MITMELAAPVDGVLAAYHRAFVTLRELAADPRPNGATTPAAVGDTLAELDAVDTAEQQLVLALVASGLPASTVARRCRIAPATVRRWVAEVTP